MVREGFIWWNIFASVIHAHRHQLVLITKIFYYSFKSSPPIETPVICRLRKKYIIQTFNHFPLETFEKIRFGAACVIMCRYHFIVSAQMNIYYNIHTTFKIPRVRQFVFRDGFIYFRVCLFSTHNLYQTCK